MNAFCYTLQDDILSDYEQALVELEEEIMMDTDIPLTYIQSKLQDYTLLFPTLILLLEEIQRRKVIIYFAFLIDQMAMPKPEAHLVSLILPSYCSNSHKRFLNQIC